GGLEWRAGDRTGGRTYRRRDRARGRRRIPSLAPWRTAAAKFLTDHYKITYGRVPRRSMRHPQQRSGVPMMIKFYYHPSPNPAKVALFLEESGLPYELVPVDTRKGEQFSPSYLAINPNATTPA